VAYHYESTTRNEDPDNLNKLKQDYHQNLVPMVKEKFESIKNKLVSI
jgi:hypothetical protein